MKLVQIENCKINEDHIMYITEYGSQCKIYLSSGAILTTTTLSMHEVEELLTNNPQQLNG